MIGITAETAGGTETFPPVCDNTKGRCRSSEEVSHLGAEETLKALTTCLLKYGLKVTL